MTEYETMMQIMSNYKIDAIQDCLHEAFEKDYKGIKCTIGDITNHEDQVVPREVGLTDPNDFFAQERLDYIMVLQEDKHLKVQTEKTIVEPFFTAKDENGLFLLPFSQLSDHYGISSEIVYN